MPFGTVYWNCLLELSSGTVYWNCLVELSIGTVCWNCLLELRPPELYDSLCWSCNRPLIKGQYLIWQLSSLIHSDHFPWLQAAQRWPPFQFAVSRHSRFLVRCIIVNIFRCIIVNIFRCIIVNIFLLTVLKKPVNIFLLPLAEVLCTYQIICLHVERADGKWRMTVVS
jgi:hypothetical protein